MREFSDAKYWRSSVNFRRDTALDGSHWSMFVCKYCTIASNVLDGEAKVYIRRGVLQHKLKSKRPVAVVSCTYSSAYKTSDLGRHIHNTSRIGKWPCLAYRLTARGPYHQTEPIRHRLNRSVIAAHFLFSTGEVSVMKTTYSEWCVFI